MEKIKIYGIADPNDLIDTEPETDEESVADDFDNDDISNDETFTMSQKEMDSIEKQDGHDDDEMGRTAVAERKRKSNSSQEKGPQIKKKDREF